MDPNNQNLETFVDVPPQDDNTAHNGKQISLVSVSPNGTYAVTYSSEDNSIEGWIADEQNSEWTPLKRNHEVTAYKLTNNDNSELNEIKVNDKKIVLCSWQDSMIIIQMSKHNQLLKILKQPPIGTYYFKENGDLVIISMDSHSHYQAFIYSLHDKNNELTLISSYKFCSSTNGVIIEDNKVWAFSSNYLFQLDFKTFQSKFRYSLGIEATYDKNFIVRSKGNLILVKCHNEIVIFLREMRFPIQYIQMKCSTIKAELLCNNNYLLAFNLPEKDEKQDIRLYHTTEINKQPVDASKIFNDNDSENSFILCEYDIESENAFGLVNGKFSSINLSNVNWHEFFESNHVDDEESVGWNSYLCLSDNYHNDTLNFPDMENIKSLISNGFTDYPENIDINFNNQKYKWRINQKHEKLLVYKISLDANEVLLCSIDLLEVNLYNWEILDNNALALLYHSLIIIYKYDANNEKIKIQYYFRNYSNEKENIRDSIEKFSGSRLPMIDIKAFLREFDSKSSSSHDELLENIIEDVNYLVEYESTLSLSNLIDRKLTSFIESIYGKCIKLVKEDPKRNLNIINIITSSMKDLYEEYPDYISKFNSEMFIFLDPFNEKITNNENYSHFYTFSQEIEICKISNYSKYFEYFIFLLFYFVNYLIAGIPLTSITFITLVIIIQDSKYLSNYFDNSSKILKFFSILSKYINKYLKYFLLPLLIYPFLEIFLNTSLLLFPKLLVYFLVINYFLDTSKHLKILFSIVFFLDDFPSILVVIFFKETFNNILLRNPKYFIVMTAIAPWIEDFRPLPLFSLALLIFLYLNYDNTYSKYIILVVPYTNYSCYPLEYSWWKEIFYKPQSSVFVNTCKKEFYTNWNGEAIINFKWDKFGKYYYFAIWLKFIAFLVCFMIAAGPTSITQELRINLFITSTIFGFLHLIFELRQFIWNPKIYFSSTWNWFDLNAYLFVIITSMYWIQNNNAPDWALSISCLLLDLKFLLFFRIIESFGIYFAIIVGVAKRVFSFIVVLAIIIASFTHAFFILLYPPTLNIPDEKSNLFNSYFTSLLAMYLFLTGNQNSLSSWTPTRENMTLFILMIIFSLFVVIYLMNLFIGLVNMAIEKENNRASYLVQKAEILAEIELFYLLPHQRRRKSWFPDIIYYTVSVEKARIYIKEAINKGEWKMDDWPEMKYKILKLLNMEDAIKA